MCLYQVMMTLHILNDVINDTKIYNYVIMASLKSEPTCKLIIEYLTPAVKFLDLIFRNNFFIFNISKMCSR